LDEGDVTMTYMNPIVMVAQNLEASISSDFSQHLSFLRIGILKLKSIQQDYISSKY